MAARTELDRVARDYARGMSRRDLVKTALAGVAIGMLGRARPVAAAMPRARRRARNADEELRACLKAVPAEAEKHAKQCAKASRSIACTSIRGRRSGGWRANAKRSTTLLRDVCRFGKRVQPALCRTSTQLEESQRCFRAYAERSRCGQIARCLVCSDDDDSFDCVPCKDPCSILPVVDEVSQNVEHHTLETYMHHQLMEGQRREVTFLRRAGTVVASASVSYYQGQDGGTVMLVYYKGADGAGSHAIALGDPTPRYGLLVGRDGDVLRQDFPASASTPLRAPQSEPQRRRQEPPTARAAATECSWVCKTICKNVGKRWCELRAVWVCAPTEISIVGGIICYYTIATVCRVTSQVFCEAVCGAGCQSPACPPGQALCDQLCLGIEGNPYCGACFKTCRGGKICRNGACVCPEGTGDCGDACYDPQKCEVCDQGIVRQLCPDPCFKCNGRGCCSPFCGTPVCGQGTSTCRSIDGSSCTCCSAQQTCIAGACV